jgi:hypothetical protein
MKCIQCSKEFEGRSDARYCSASCRKSASRGVTDNHVTDKNVTDNVTDNSGKKVRYLSDLGVDLKELGVASCGPGLPILLVDMPTNDQIQGLCKVIHALNGDMEWEPRCGMGNSF